MEICFNKLSGLALLRRARVSGSIAYAEVCGLPDPDSSPQSRWTSRMIPHDLFGMDGPPTPSSKVFVAVPSSGLRPKASFFSTTVYSRGTPAGSFLQLSDSLVIPCPELLFVELANVMHPAVHELLGYELCGSYARNAANPRCGNIEHGLPSVTSVDSIREFVGRCGQINGKRRALRALENICDNAWSSMESLCALFMRRAPDQLGYGFGNVQLNVREETSHELVSRGCKASRVPDIVLVDHPIGFNYDGYDHLDLNSILKVIDSPTELKRKLEEIRRKYVDDRKRDRELAARGRIVMPIISEDLSSPYGLDTVVIEALMTSEQLGGPPRAGALPDAAWEDETVRARQELIQSLLPWGYGKSLGPF